MTLDTPSAVVSTSGVKVKEPVAERVRSGMVMVNWGTAAKPPDSPTTSTVTSVAVVSVRPSDREAVTVMVCAPSPSDTSVLSSDNRMADSLSRMVREAGATGHPGVRLTPATVSVLSGLAAKLSETGRLKEAEALVWLAGMVIVNGEGAA